MKSFERKHMPMQIFHKIVIVDEKIKTKMNFI